MQDDGGAGLDRPMRRRRGKGTLLTTDVSDKVVTALRAGSTVHDACQYANIDDQRFYEWRSRGLDYDDYVSETVPNEFVEDPFEQIFRDFALAVDSARSEARVRANITIVEVMDKRNKPADRLRAATWLLARSAPNDWGPVKRLELSGPDGQPLIESQSATVRLAARLRKNFPGRLPPLAVEGTPDDLVVDAEVVDDEPTAGDGGPGPVDHGHAMPDPAAGSMPAAPAIDDVDDDYDPWAPFVGDMMPWEIDDDDDG